MARHEKHNKLCEICWGIRWTILFVGDGVVLTCSKCGDDILFLLAKEEEEVDDCG